MKETLASYYVRCDGALPSKSSSLIDQRPEASITVFSDGKREVGCSYIDQGKCTLAETLTGVSLPNCIHLFPESSKPGVENLSSTGHEADSNQGKEIKIALEEPASLDEWPYHFNKTKDMIVLEKRFPGTRVDDIIKWAIDKTSTLDEAAKKIEIPRDRLINWKNQFDIKLPLGRSHRH